MQLTCTISDGQLWVSNGSQEGDAGPRGADGTPGREL